MPDHVWCPTVLLVQTWDPKLGHCVRNHFWWQPSTRTYRQALEGHMHAAALPGLRCGLCGRAGPRLCAPRSRALRSTLTTRCSTASPQDEAGRQASWRLRSLLQLMQLHAQRSSCSEQAQERGEVGGQALHKKRRRCRHWTGHCCNAARGAGAVTASSLWQLEGNISPKSSCTHLYVHLQLMHHI